MYLFYIIRCPGTSSGVDRNPERPEISKSISRPCLSCPMAYSDYGVLASNCLCPCQSCILCLVGGSALTGLWVFESLHGWTVLGGAVRNWQARDGALHRHTLSYHAVTGSLSLLSLSVSLSVCLSVCLSLSHTHTHTLTHTHTNTQTHTHTHTHKPISVDCENKKESYGNNAGRLWEGWVGWREVTRTGKPESKTWRKLLPDRYPPTCRNQYL